MSILRRAIKNADVKLFAISIVSCCCLALTIGRGVRAQDASPQDKQDKRTAESVVTDVAKTIGAANVKSIQYSGTGFDGYNYSCRRQGWIRHAWWLPQALGTVSSVAAGVHNMGVANVPH